MNTIKLAFRSISDLYTTWPRLLQYILPLSLTLEKKESTLYCAHSVLVSQYSIISHNRLETVNSQKKLLPRVARTWSRSSSVSRIFCCCWASFSSYCILIKFFSRSLRFSCSIMFTIDDISVVRSEKLAVSKTQRCSHLIHLQKPLTGFINNIYLCNDNVNFNCKLIQCTKWRVGGTVAQWVVKHWLAINGSWVQFPPGQNCITTLASCSHLCASVTKQYNLVLVERWWRSLAGKVTWLKVMTANHWGMT